MQIEYLLVAASARWLVESAVRGGSGVAAIDAFGDRETLDKASFFSLAPLRHGGLAPRFAAAFHDIAHRFSGSLKGWVAGPGLENCTGMFHSLNQRLPLLGSSTDAWRCSTSHQSITRLAQRLGLRLPPQAAAGPALSKFAAAAGGGHVKYLPPDAQPGARRYREAYLPGAAVSHLFLADGCRAATVGFSLQWQSRHDAARPFCYGGALNRCPLTAEQTGPAETWSGALTQALGLRGLNNVDYLLCGGGLYFLELNPRPGATMMLYDADYPRGLFNAHLRACRGELSAPQTPTAARAHAVVYAHRKFTLPYDFAWPEQARDVPAREQVFNRGDPVCSLFAEAGDAASALSALQHSLRGMGDISPHFQMLA